MNHQPIQLSRKTLVGMLSGIALPAVVLIAVWLYQLPTISLWRYWKLMMEWGAMKHQMMLTVIVNMMLFYVFYRFENTEGARGVVVSTLLLAIITVILYC